MAKQRKKKDPHRKREAQKYEHPVPSREFILAHLTEIDRPVTLSHLLQVFDLDSEEERIGLKRRLRAMERDGQLIANRRGSYAIVDKMGLLPGRVVGHKDGFGFFIPDDRSGDVFLPAREMRKIFSGDRVLVRASSKDRRGRSEGVIVEVLERNTARVAGRFFSENGVAYVDPDSKNITHDILIAPDKTAGAQPGQFVVAELLTQPKGRLQPTGHIIEILGDQLTPGMEVELAIRAHDLPFVFSEAVIAEAKKIPLDVKEADFAGRKDLRTLPFVTIDGEDAKDFDDAVYCEKNQEGFALYVAIADVTHYLKPDSALDVEAQERGNSVYFPSKVIPMLPEVLSNGLCSLLPEQNRLVMVCEMQLDAQGNLLRYEFYPSVIFSHARLTYTQVASMLAGEVKTHSELLPHLNTFYHLFKELLKQREQRGAIEFDTTETKIIFDADGKIDKITPTVRNDAHRMIEEAMLLANVCAADFLEKAEIPAVFRNHPPPDDAKLLALRDFLKAFSLRLSGGNKPTSKDFMTLLNRIQNRPDTHLLQTVMLRSLQQAVYRSHSEGHFGLSYDSYTHFTSPIRRYPDVLVHRAIKHLLKKKSAKGFRYTEDTMESLGEHFSTTERRADLATRDATDWLKCDYMKDKVGQSFDGVIADVTGFGIFVELQDIYVQGLVHITSLENDYYQYESTQHLLRGKRSGKTYRLGDQIRVLVARVDLDERVIDFELA